MKSCPRCRALAFDDIETCFSCLYPFDLPMAMDDYVEPDEPGGSYVGLGRGPFSQAASAAFLLRVIQDGAARGRTVLIKEGQTVRFGRAMTNDVLFEARNISRRHALICVEEGHLTVEDLGSVNGTFLGGQRITEKRPLCAGDVVRMGAASIEVCIADTS